MKAAITDLVFIDIETVSQSPEFDQLSEEWQQHWQDKNRYQINNDVTAAQYYTQRAAVMAEFGKVVCISIGYFKPSAERQLRVTSLYDKDEKQLLQRFIQTIGQIEAVNRHWCFAGHNIKEFDIPFLCRRLIINGVALPHYLDFQNMKPWETNIIDTFQYWRFGDYKHFTSLKLLAACLGVPSPKDDIDGSMVGEVYWKENDISRIVTYCQKDVVTVANIVLRFMNEPLLIESEVVIV